MAAAAPQKRSAKAPTKRLAPVHAHPAAPAGRFAELLTEVHIPDPYVITEQLKIEPPTRNRMEQVQAAQAAFAIANGQLQDMLTPVKQVKRNADGSPEIDEAGNQVTFDVLPAADPKHLEQIQAVVTGASDRFNRALFGEQYGAVMEYFDGEPVQVWNAFYTDIQNKFMPLPESGQCPTCGHVEDAEQAGKPLASTNS